MTFPALLLLAVWVLSNIFDSPNVRNDLIQEIIDNLPIEQVQGRREIEDLLDQLTRGAGGLGILTAVVLIYSSSAAIGALRHAVETANEKGLSGPAFPKYKGLDILILLVTLPAYVGMAATAEPMVLTFLGEKWLETATINPILALAMPFLTLQILFAPATNALGKPGIALGNSIAGGLVLPVSFGVGSAWGITGLSVAWMAGMALLTLVTAIRSMPVIGTKWRTLGAAIAPGLLASQAMGIVVVGVDSQMPVLPPLPHLLVLAGIGAATYAAMLWMFARNTVAEAWALLRHR